MKLEMWSSSTSVPSDASSKTIACSQVVPLLGYDAMKTSRGPVASCLMAASVDADVIGSSGNSSSAMASAAWSAVVKSSGVAAPTLEPSPTAQKTSRPSPSRTWYAAQ